MATIEIVDDKADEPVLTIYPEERRATVNCAALADRDEGITATRLEREIWRAICFVGGAGYSDSKFSLVQPISSIAELDAIESKGVTMTTIAQFKPFFAKYGVKKGSKTTYRNAVRQGWAPAPTNDVQRAVWNEVREKTEIK